MSNYTAEAEPASKSRIQLRTTDQYSLWLARTSTACWSATGIDTCHLKNADYVKASAAYKQSRTTDYKGDILTDWVGKCWSIITLSLHDELFVKLTQVPPGQIETLLSEIQGALLIDAGSEIFTIRFNLYAASMNKCDNDLQTYIANVCSNRDKLIFLKSPVAEADLVLIFIRGLHSVFSQLQLYFSIPGSTPDTLNKTITIVRNYCASPAMLAELQKLKTAGLSQNLFPMVTNTRSKATCYNFSRTGSCNYGSKCNFSHTSTPEGQNSKQSNSTGCTWCTIKGHIEAQCNKKKAGVTKGAYRKRLRETQGNSAQPISLVAQSDYRVDSSQHDFSALAASIAADSGSFSLCFTSRKTTSL